MRELTKISNWIIFLILITPFIVSGLLENLFYLLGVFLSIYWIVSVGKFGSLILEKDGSKYWMLFNISIRLIFISLFAHYFILKYYNDFYANISEDVLLFICDTIFYVSFVAVTIYSSYIYILIAEEKISLPKIILTSFLFWIFPIGVWVLQPKINKYIGENLE